MHAILVHLSSIQAFGYFYAGLVVCCTRVIAGDATGMLQDTGVFYLLLLWRFGWAYSMTLMFALIPHCEKLGKGFFDSMFVMAGLCLPRSSSLPSRQHLSEQNFDLSWLLGCKVCPWCMGCCLAHAFPLVLTLPLQCDQES